MPPLSLPIPPPLSREGVELSQSAINNPQSAIPLSRARLEEILASLPSRRVGIIGDFTLDAYWYADMVRAELSREVPLYNRPVVRETYSPGGAANVAWNVASLGVGEPYALTLMGDDWRGDLLRGLLRREGVCLDHALLRPERITPCYAKVLLTAHALQQEDARLDFFNSGRPGPEAEAELVASLKALAPQLDALIVNDQLADGLITPRVHQTLVDLAAAHSQMAFVVDSRSRIDRFPGMTLKPNDLEAASALFPGEPPDAIPRDRLLEATGRWQREQGRPIYITIGSEGCLVFSGGEAVHVAGVALQQPVDPVGAGDTFISALAACLAAGASPVEAGQVAVLASAVSVCKLHVTGTASPAEILEMHARLNTGTIEP
jgi:rfaE bifunctional protein kinase chain/domain